MASTTTPASGCIIRAYRRKMGLEAGSVLSVVRSFRAEDPSPPPADVCSPRTRGGAGSNRRVTLANGDHITGEVVRVERGRLEFKTNDAGTLYLEWDKLSSLVANRFVEVLTRGRPAIPWHARSFVHPFDQRVGLGGPVSAPDVGRHPGDADRPQLLEQDRWFDRPGLQLHAVERRRPVQSQLGHPLPKARLFVPLDGVYDRHAKR